MSLRREVDGIYLVIDEGYAEDIREEEDDFVCGVLAGGCANVAFDAADVLDLPYETVDVYI